MTAPTLKVGEALEIARRITDPDDGSVEELMESGVDVIDALVTEVEKLRAIIEGRAVLLDDTSAGACPDCGDVFASGFEDPTAYCAAHRPTSAEHVAEAVDAGTARRDAPLVLVRIERTQVIYAAMPLSEADVTGAVVIDTDTARNWCDKEDDDTIIAHVADRKPPAPWMAAIPYGCDSSDDTIAQRLAAGTLVLWSER